MLKPIARPLLAAMFVYGGLDSFRHPESKAPTAESVAPKVASQVGLPQDTVLLVRLNGAAQVAAGATLALGVLPRLSALVLAGSLVPTTAAGHRFWEQDEPAAKRQQTIHFLKNAALLGGLLMVVDAG
jgi:putative oxidoreductase